MNKLLLFANLSTVKILVIWLISATIGAITVISSGNAFAASSTNSKQTNTNSHTNSHINSHINSLSSLQSKITNKQVKSPQKQTQSASTIQKSAVQRSTPGESTLKLQKDSSLQPSKKSDYTVHFTALVARSTSLYDHQDGTKTDGMDYGFVPSLSTPYGTLSSKITYSQNLRDTSTDGGSDLNDIPITFSLKSNKWNWSLPWALTWAPSITAMAPVSKLSTKKDNLQTVLVGGVRFSLFPDGVTPKTDSFWNLGLGLTFGQYFHTYEEDINGSILNKYTSNQSVSIAYTYKKLTFSFDFVHNSRWTYQNNVKEAFEHSEEVSYAFTPNFSMSMGHTNAGSVLKANGVDSNYDFIDENNSKVFATMAISF